jgi:hypothetical protein
MPSHLIQQKIGTLVLEGETLDAIKDVGFGMDFHMFIVIDVQADNDHLSQIYL